MAMSGGHLASPGAGDAAVDSERGVRIAPSILSADFGALRSEIQAVVAGGAALIHLDVMDGHFVPNLTIGPAVVRSVRSATDLPFDAHLMVTDPAAFFEPFRDAGADRLTVHFEVIDDPVATAGRLRELGMRPGLALNPDTPLEPALGCLEAFDLLLLMTVHPGFGGQAFRADVLPKIRRAATLIRELGLALDLEVDGGINHETVGAVVEAGAEILVAGSAVFRRGEAEPRTRALRAAALAAADRR